MDFNENLSDLLIYYLEAQGFTEEQYEDKYSLRNDGDGDSYIDRWDISVLQPTKEQLLALDINEVKAKKTRKGKLRGLKENKLPTLTDDELSKIKNKLPNGSLFINGSTKKINYIVDGVLYVV